MVWFLATILCWATIKLALTLSGLDTVVEANSLLSFWPMALAYWMGRLKP